MSLLAVRIFALRADGGGSRSRLWRGPGRTKRRASGPRPHPTPPLHLPPAAALRGGSRGAVRGRRGVLSALAPFHGADLRPSHRSPTTTPGFDQTHARWRRALINKSLLQIPLCSLVAAWGDPSAKGPNSPTGEGGYKQVAWRKGGPRTTPVPTTHCPRIHFRGFSVPRALPKPN